MIRTRQVNRWLGTAYTVEEVAEWPWEAHEVFDAVVAGTKEG